MDTTFWSLLKRGLLLGLLCGAVAGLAAQALGEPSINAAIALEEAAAAATPPPAESAHSHDHGHSHGEVSVSRPAQRAGLVLATGLSGAVIGGLLAIALAGFRRRHPGADPLRTTLALGFAGLYGWVLVPAIVAPANPPAVGDPETITSRTAAYVVAVGCGLLLAWLAARIVRSYGGAQRPWLAWAIVPALGLAGIVVLAAVLPAPAAAPPGFPADLLWEFRIGSLATQLLLWVPLTVSMAALTAAREAPAATSQPTGPTEPLPAHA